MYLLCIIHHSKCYGQKLILFNKIFIPSEFSELKIHSTEVS
jgi:hypothetical protein